ncbi:MAG: hypothetical protein WCK31_01530, partial [bacterium]
IPYNKDINLLRINMMDYDKNSESFEKLYIGAMKSAKNDRTIQILRGAQSNRSVSYIKDGNHRDFFVREIGELTKGKGKEWVAIVEVAKCYVKQEPEVFQVLLDIGEHQARQRTRK